MLRWIVGVSLVVGCGARTDLEQNEPAGDGATPDLVVSRDLGVDSGPPLVRPACLERLPPGEVRGTLDGVDGRITFDPEGNLHGLRLLGDVTTLHQWDPCLRERWSVVIPFERPRRNAARIAWTPSGDLFVHLSLELFRVSRDGEVLPLGLDTGDQLLFTFVASAPYPVLATTTPGEEPKVLRAFPGGDSRRVDLMEPSSFVYRDECLVDRQVVGCWDVAYGLPELDALWAHSRPRLIDGTFRHVLPPVSDGERMISVLFGISTYELEAQDLRTGERAWRTPMARSTRGQTDLLVGGPILVDGRVVTYLSVHRETGPDGQLEAFDLRGERAWSYPAERTRSPREIFDTDATHVAGDAGLVYLVVGESMHAVDLRSGVARWVAELGESANEPHTNLSPLGDLTFRTDAGDVWVVATESEGPADAPWPIPLHDPMGTNGR